MGGASRSLYGRFRPRRSYDCNNTASGHHWYRRSQSHRTGRRVVEGQIHVVDDETTTRVGHELDLLARRSDQEQVDVDGSRGSEQ